MPYKSIEMQKANKREYYLKNRKRFLVARKKYRAENREKVLECQRECYRKNASAIKEYQKEYYAENQEYVDARNKAYVSNHKAEVQKWQRDHRIKNLKRVLVYSAKRRAAILGIPFDISPDDFEIPTHCPIFGFKLEVGNRGFNASSPSLDRIIPKLGYVKGNIQVVSYRANELKRDASLEELEMLVSYLRRITKKQSEHL
jgi:hypothetical protein